MNAIDLNYLKKVIITALVTVVIGNLGAWIGFYYNTSNTIEILELRAEKQALIIQKLEENKADRREVDNVVNDLRNSIILFNSKIDNITKILIDLSRTR